MRQWMVDPKIMCRQHLLGEHLEHHMFVGALNKKLEGYLKNNLLEPRSLKTRHDELAKEMVRRGYKHNSPLPEFSVDHLPDVKIDKGDSLDVLLKRCKKCGRR